MRISQRVWNAGLKAKPEVRILFGAGGGVLEESDEWSHFSHGPEGIDHDLARASCDVRSSIRRLPIGEELQ